MKHVTFQEGMTLLDLGSGLGVDVFAAAIMHRDKECKIIGVDSTMKMVARARKIARENHLANVEFRLGEIENLPIERESVDIVTSNCVINLVPDKSRAFKEIYRVLKPGGIITISDIVTKEPLPERIRNDPSKWSECVSGALTIDELKHFLAESGLSDFKVLEESRWDKHAEGEELQLASITFSAEKGRNSSSGS
jgi:arsenite methyltransferase